MRCFFYHADIFCHAEVRSISPCVSRDASYLSMTKSVSMIKSREKYFHLLIFIFFIFFTQNIFAQQDSLANDPLVDHKVVLLPFDTIMYLSDAEQYILHQT